VHTKPPAAEPLPGPLDGCSWTTASVHGRGSGPQRAAAAALAARVSNPRPGGTEDSVGGGACPPYASGFGSDDPGVGHPKSRGLWAGPGQLDGLPSWPCIAPTCMA
jgi:hypothetical protein